ncbi:DNA (cytosine-5-)-methyltransferase [Bacillus weihaiensis]|uniref:Cytosine-specific methyltransferase n=1 Tax=Bacillus weihaiensis TaxID=1547283 RepID=A0A1L3MXN0_9BACI|nr:DNA (cytosine-5-)-methyltransferase [Bacillus weihaiensis]
MFLKIEERGRAKYKPAKNYDVADVQNLLLEKITEEQLRLQSVNDAEDFSTINFRSDKLNVVSLFSGCGGLDLGTELAGLDALYGKEEVESQYNIKDSYDRLRTNSIFHTVCTIDMFKEANQSYKNNFPSSVFQIEKDIRKIKNFPMSDMVIGGFPCPGFSEAGPRLIDDERNFLYIHFIRCLLQTKPFFFVAENVKGLLTLGKGEVAKQIIQDFESAGYKVKFQLVNAVDYGAPQNRERVFIVGVRNDIKYKYEFPNPTHGVKNDLLPYKTLKDSIYDLIDDPGEWYEGGFSSMYLSRNRKKTWEDPSFTIQASGRQAPLHPSGESMRKIDKDLWELPGGAEKHRRLSSKEIARIQTFPDWFTFSKGLKTAGSKNSQIDKVYKQIGNAVPVELARVMISPIAKWSIENMDYLIKKRETTHQLVLL